ncbi:hypothetical protein AB9F26_12115 [Falsihalocynthiibacter sp. BN13B15]|uniref:hypothetical protein n=1 Tax=Falsihalocynthiibacter sp. BN13B15 TaxID=3240871 RepID=UPI00350EE8C0
MTGTDSNPNGAYPLGFEGVLRKISAHRTQYADITGILPYAAANLPETVAKTVTAGPYIKPEARDRRPVVDLWSKQLEFSQEFEGKSEILVVHGLCIACLRRDAPPPETIALFHTLWRDYRPLLIAQLNMRWLISAATTFGDHGENSTQIKVGSNLEMLFGLFKLYESERLHAGFAPGKPHPFRMDKNLKLPLGMSKYAIAGGDLDQQLLGKLYLNACDDPIMEDLCHTMLNRLISTNKSMFSRFRILRDRRAASRKGPRNNETITET